MGYGYNGTVVRVNLTTGAISEEKPVDNFYRTYFGGAGFVSHYLLKETERGLDPLSPGNKLIFATGVVTGAPVSGSGRHCVGAKSPMTGGFGKSESGGFWGAELKKTGFDAVIVEGRSEKPVYLWIHDENVEIRDASHLWGKTTLETQEAIRAELNDRLVRVAQIGRGGESVVRFACIINDLRNAAGRSGMGAVMGSKNLKAIAVRGSRMPEFADPLAVAALARYMAQEQIQRGAGKVLHDFGTGSAFVPYNRSGNLPVRNFRDGYIDDAEKVSAQAIRDQIRVGMESCYACAVRCKKVVKAEEPYHVDPAYGGPEYETMAAFGPNCGITDLVAVAKAHELCQAYSIDTISTGVVISFAMECFENGLLTSKETGGIDLRFGNVPAMLEMIEMIGNRSGIGNLLAEGTARAAREIGRGADRFAMQIKGVEIPMHEPRLKWGLALNYCLSPAGPDHQMGAHDTFYQGRGQIRDELDALGIIEPPPLYDLSARKVTLCRLFNQWRMLRDTLVLCNLVPYHFDQVIDLLKATTGWKSSSFDAMRVGERVLNLARVFNMREGLTATDDYLPERFHSPTTFGALQDTAIDKQAMETAVHKYYEQMGWDPITGLPKLSKLEDLDVGWAADQLPA